MFSTSIFCVNKIEEYTLHDKQSTFGRYILRKALAAHTAPESFSRNQKIRWNLIWE